MPRSSPWQNRPRQRVRPVIGTRKPKVGNKVEALLVSGALPRSVVASFAALLPAAKSVLFRLLKGRDLARVSASPAKDRIVADATR